MLWVYRFDERALKELRKLGQQAQRDIITYLDERVAGGEEVDRFVLDGFLAIEGTNKGRSSRYTRETVDERLVAQFDRERATTACMFDAEPQT